MPILWRCWKTFSRIAPRKLDLFERNWGKMRSWKDISLYPYIFKSGRLGTGIPLWLNNVQKARCSLNLQRNDEAVLTSDYGTMILLKNNQANSSNVKCKMKEMSTRIKWILKQMWFVDRRSITDLRIDISVFSLSVLFTSNCCHVHSFVSFS